MLYRCKILLVFQHFIIYSHLDVLEDETEFTELAEEFVNSLVNIITKVPVK
jgi:ABC-type histidine transport system ATPase subunit